MKTKMIVLGLIATSIIGCAQDNYYYNDNSNYQDESSNTQYVKVVDSRPVYDNAVERTPYEYCRNVRVPVRRGGNSGGFDAQNGLGTLIGGVAGGILGHQVGGGNGKTVATIGGAILGSAVGNNLSRRDRDNGRVYYEQRRECETRYRESRKRVLTGYNNIGYYKGQKIVKFSSNRLRTIPVQVTISY